MKQTSVSFEIYMKEISSAPVLSREEEVELFRQLQEGDETVREEIVRCNLRFVVKIANQFSGQGMPLSDLIQEGNIGLLDVIDKFEHEKGYRFSTYAAFWIRQAIQMALRRQRGITRLPVRKSRLLGHINNFMQEYQKLEGHEPSEYEVGEQFGLNDDQVRQMMELRKNWCSLDEEYDEEHRSLLDTLADEDQPSPRELCEVREIQRHVNEWMSETLDAREQTIIGLRFGFANGHEHSLRRASKFVGLSQEGVRRIEKKALHKLRRPALACVA
jgi:RNA polymerase primary sigma factor